MQLLVVGLAEFGSQFMFDFSQIVLGGVLELLRVDADSPSYFNDFEESVNTFPDFGDWLVLLLL